MLSNNSSSNGHIGDSDGSRLLNIKDATREIITISLNRLLEELKDETHYLNVKDLKELVTIVVNADKGLLDGVAVDDKELSDYEVTLGGYEDEI